MSFYLRICVGGLVCLAGCTTVDEDRWRRFNDDGIQLFAQGNYRDALDSFDYALTLHSGDAVLIFNVAQCYDRLGDLKNAEQYYKACLQRDARHGDARLALLELMYRTGRVGEANQHIQEWLQQSPNASDAYVFDAWRLRHAQAYPQAQARLQQALSINPNNRRALTELAMLFELQNLPDRALILYERILLNDPNQPEIVERVNQLRAKGVQRPLPS